MFRTPREKAAPYAKFNRYGRTASVMEIEADGARPLMQKNGD